MLSKLNVEIQPLQENETTYLFAANMTVVPIIGKVNLKFEVNRQMLNYDFYVVNNLSNNIIFGIDLMTCFNVTIEYSTGVIGFCHNQFSVPFIRKQDFSGMARLTNNVMLNVDDYFH